MALKAGNVGVAPSEVDARGKIKPPDVPIATPTAAGTVKPVSKTEGMTQDVGIDSAGKLYTAPGSVYTLPVATPLSLGGVKPVSKTEGMTQDVGVDSEGKLYTVPGSGGGGGQIYYKDFTIKQGASTSQDSWCNTSKDTPVDVPGYTPISVTIVTGKSSTVGVVSLADTIYYDNHITIVRGFGQFNGNQDKVRVFYVKNEDVSAIPTT